jgi:hypothetical protein
MCDYSVYYTLNVETNYSYNSYYGKTYSYDTYFYRYCSEGYNYSYTLCCIDNVTGLDIFLWCLYGFLGILFIVLVICCAIRRRRQQQEMMLAMGGG